jgi:hypothetical protein
MAGKRGFGLACLVLLGMFTGSIAHAGPFLGDWGWCWNPAPGCPPRLYSALHYQAPGIYRVRGWVHPSYLDQFAPGPSPTPPAPIQFEPSACRSIPPAPTAPYANPAAFFGRPSSPGATPP